MTDQPNPAAFGDDSRAPVRVAATLPPMSAKAAKRIKNPAHAKQANNAGNVRQLTSGRWQARYTDPSGKLRSLGTYDTKTDAQRALRKATAAVDSGDWSRPGAEEQTLGDYLSGWLASRERGLAVSTMDGYRDLAARFVMRPLMFPTRRAPVTLGDLPITQALNGQIIREWLDAVRDDVRLRRAAQLAKQTSQPAPTSPLGRRTPHTDAREWAQSQGLPVGHSGRVTDQVMAAWRQAGAPRPVTDATPGLPADYGDTQRAKAWSLIRAVWNDAYAEQVARHHPPRFRLQRAPRSRQLVHATIDDVRALVAAMPPQYGALVWLSFTAGGLRSGEALALRRRDIDLYRDDQGAIIGGMVTVARGVIFPRDKAAAPIYKPTKTGAESVDKIPAFVARLVAGHLGHFVPDASPDALLFTATDGGQLRRDVYRRAFARAAAKIGKPELTPHSLRRGYASAMSADGVPIRDIQAGGRWATAAMVMHYAKPLDDAIDRRAQVWADLGL